VAQLEVDYAQGYAYGRPEPFETAGNRLCCAPMKQRSRDSRRHKAAKMTDIARLAGVHVSTVSRALAGSPLVEAGKRKRIEQLAREHSYVVNPVARGLRLKRTQMVSVAVPLQHEAGQPLTDPFFVAMLGHLAEAITQRGYGMNLQKVVLPTHEWLDELIASGRSDGVVVIGQSTEHETLQRAAAVYLPLVVWGAQLPGQRYCTVGSDNPGGAQAAVQHLLRAGRRQIVFLGDPTGPELRQRYEGYARALAQAPAGTAAARVVPAHLTPDAAYHAVRECIRAGEPFDALFAASDVIAISAIRALAGEGLSVPQDVAVVGFDDIPLAAHTTPSLSTVRQDIEQGARTLIELLFRRLEGEETDSVILPVELLVRESSPV
jgi:DNA-binding LacI/PurR family transcriptional regulator